MDETKGTTRYIVQKSSVDFDREHNTAFAGWHSSPQSMALRAGFRDILRLEIWLNILDDSDMKIDIVFTVTLTKVP